ncbi:MAG: SpoIID/LytB domain-containing protein [Clostridia bacterium]|nr:SpoIID/LytB domain-containing protein [Clostridia bacterium]
MSNRKPAVKLIRALSALLAALFIFSPTSFFTEVKALPMSSYAFDTIKTEEEFRVAVGVRYGSSAYPLHAMTSPYGFVFGEAEISRTEHNFTPLYTIEESDIAAVVDTNLTIGYQSCEIATSEKNTDIGGYHVEISNASKNVWNNLEDLRVIFGAQYDHVFPAYINGQKTIRIGSYPNYSSASAAAAAVGATLDDFTISVASPSSEGVCYLNSDYDTILFEYSGDEGFCGGVCARQIAGAEYSYLYYSRNSSLYDGVFCFKRYLSDSEGEGLSMINLVRMQEYVEGVIPNEISNTWPIECLRAFALMVRSFAIANINRHYSAYGFDVCSSSCCQVYQGRKQVNDTVIEAVRSTRNEILVCGDTIVESAYSSSQGGYTVGSQYVWGGSLPYLVNQPTPWEDYGDVKNGLWTAEITEKELAKAFKNAGYSAIKGSRIVDFSYQTSDDSPYLYSFTGIDEKGNSATATRAAKVKSLFGSTVKSANFTIAKGELTYTYTDVLANRIINLAGSVSGKINVYTGEGVKETDISLLSFMTDLGQALSDASKALFVKTGEGVATLTPIEVGEIPVSTMPDADGYYTIVSNFGDFLVVSEVRDITETIKASNKNNYVIAGMGYGHGVGASQYGVLHLAKAGATYEQIVRAYYSGTQIVNIKDYFN